MERVNKVLIFSSLRRQSPDAPAVGLDVEGHGLLVGREAAVVERARESSDVLCRLLFSKCHLRHPLYRPHLVLDWPLNPLRQHRRAFFQPDAFSRGSLHNHRQNFVLGLQLALKNLERLLVHFELIKVQQLLAIHLKTRIRPKVAQRLAVVVVADLGHLALALHLFFRRGLLSLRNF